MMPSAQSITTTMMTPSPKAKVKIGFSIDSIVGNQKNNIENVQFIEDSNETKTPKLPADLQREYSQLIKRARHLTPSPQNTDVEHNLITRLSESSEQDHQNNNNSSKDGRLTPTRSPSPGNQKGPIIVPGLPASLVRSQMVGPSHPTHSHYPDISSSHPHFLAQFQAAAALAHAQASQSGFSGGMPQHLPPHMHNPNMHRDSYPLYPWLLSRHGRMFPHRFPHNFLLQPFRKPKRVRTAFSPSQLLKLEHAFEGNHYVVGAERKTLAQQLSLTETQVKVWFQNRRTKHKRMMSEDGDSKSGNKSTGSPKNFDDDDDDEMIDIDECPSEDEENMA